MSTVLIADDSEFMRTTIRSILVSADYDIIGEASDGQEAYDAYKRLKPDLVTMDISMLPVDGIQSLKMIREYNSEAVVVMCSAMGQQNMVLEAIKSGAKEFIVKPFTAEKVLGTISKALRC